MKKVLSLVLAVVMALSSAVTAFAQSFTPAVDKAAVKAGEDVTVTLSFEEAVVDVTSFEARLYYNSNLFDYKSNTLSNANGYVTEAPQSDAEGTYMEITHFEMSGFGTVAAGEYGEITFTAKSDISEKQVAEFTARVETGLMKNGSLISTENVKIETTVSPAACDHADTETAYTAKGDGNHTVTVTCKKCGEVISTSEEACAGDDEHTTYVSKNDGTHEKTVKCAKCDYVISTETEPCTKGEDGKCAHCGYEFPSAGDDEYTITVNVAPSTVNVTFYDENGENALAANKVVDKGVVEKYHVYEITVPEGMYSYRAVDTADNHDLGGMTFEAPISVEIGADGNPIHNEQKMTLVRVNYYTTNAKVSAVGDYSIDIMPGKMKSVVTGAQYIDEEDEYVVTPTLLHAHGNALLYNWKVTLNEELSKTYGVALSINNTFSEGVSSTQNRTFTLASLVDYSVTAPKGATVRFFNQVKNFNVEELPAYSSSENEDGTVTYVLRAPAGNITYRVSMEGKITKAGYLQNQKNYKDVTVTFGANEDPSTTKNEVSSAVLARRIEGSTMVNVNGQNNLSLGVGETFRLRAYRGAWQIINSDTANIMIEPDFHYTVISGAEHIKMTPATNRCTGNAGVGEQTNWMDIEGVSEGLVILEVRYDAIEIGGNTNYTGIYGATDPKRTSLIVINVGGDNSGLTMSAVGAENTWDTEYDTVYTLTNAATFSFNATLDGAEPTVQFSTDKGRTWKGVTKNADGSFTAYGLVEGNNILKFTANGKTVYQVVRAAKVTYTVTNATRGGNVAYAGDDITIAFSGLYQPISKFSGIYNPGFGQGHKVSYNLSDNAEFKSAGGGQYDFISTNKYTFTAKSTGSVVLSGGNVKFNVMGTNTPLGGHRILTDSGVGANFSAVSTQHVRDVLPDVTVNVKSLIDINIKFVCTPANAVVTLRDATGAVVEANADGSYTGRAGDYTYDVTADGYITVHGKFTLTEADSEGKTVTANLEKGDATVWNGKTLTEITPNADGVYEVRTGAELAWIASQVNQNVEISKVKLMNDISLGNNAWTPIGDNYKEFEGEFDGNGHVISDLYINNKNARQSLFGNVRRATITKLGVKGSVTSTSENAAGIVAYSYEGTVISECFSAVEVTGSNRVAGILASPLLESITITDCYNVGSVTATSSNGIASGICGSCSQQAKAPQITNCYNVGKVTGASRSGSISDTTKAAAVVNSYYLKGSHSLKANTGYGIEKTASEMKAAEMVTLLGGSFYMDKGNINNGYPILAWQHWGETTYTWSEDNKSVTAFHAARNNPSETETETVNTVYSEVKAATCTEKGQGKYTATFTKFAAAEKLVDIPELGHKLVHHDAVEATCAAEGSIEYWECSVCHDKFSDGDGENKVTTIVTPKDPQNHVGGTEVKNKKDATCGAEGYTGDTVCKSCDTVLVKGEAIPKKAHVWGTPTYEWSSDNGTVTAKVVCKNDSTHVHTEEVKTTAKTDGATCTEKGKITYTAAFAANEYGFTTQTKVVENASLGHDWGETTYTWSSDNKTVTATHTCKRDSSHVESEETKSVTYSEVKAATCTEKGQGKYTATFTKFAAAEKLVDIPELGHKLVHHDAVEATCAAEGNVEYWECSVCHDKFSDGDGENKVTSVVIPKDLQNHVGGTEVKNKKDATCGAEGYTGDTVCKSCDTVLVKGEAIPKKAHVWGTTSYEWSSDKGTVTAKVVCKNDSTHVHTEEVKTTTEVLKEATCTEKGKVSYTAKFAANEYGFITQIATADTPALGHKLTHHDAVAATCVAEGSIEYWECSVCGKRYSDKDAKNEVTSIVAPKDPHNHVGETEVRGYVEATCTKSGYTGDTYCKSCGELIATGKVSPVVPHKFGAWTVTKQPTKSSAGEKVRHCEVCGYEQKMELPRLSDGDVIHIGIGDNKGEQNPETGAPAPCGIAAIAVVAAAAVIFGKKKRG